MNTITSSHVLTPALWKTLTSTTNRQSPVMEPLLFLTQGVFHASDNQGYVKLRIFHELLSLDALVSVYIEGAEEPLSAQVSIADARRYGTTTDIIHQNDAFYSVIFKVIVYLDGVATPQVYLWEVPPLTAPNAIESDICLSLKKGSTFYISPFEEDIVMDRTFRMSKDNQASVNIRTVEGRSYSTTITQSDIARYAIPGDYYLEDGSGALCIIYGVTTELPLPLTPKIKYTPLPVTPRPHRDLGV